MSKKNDLALWNLKIFEIWFSFNSFLLALIIVALLYLFSKAPEWFNVIEIDKLLVPAGFCC